jgi:hypothetical protein
MILDLLLLRNDRHCNLVVPTEISGKDEFLCSIYDEDTTSTSTPAAPSPTPAPATPSSAPPSGPITRSRAREFNFVMMLKNEGPKD